MNNIPWLSRTVLGFVFASVAFVSPLLAQGITPPPKPEPQAPAANSLTLDVYTADSGGFSVTSTLIAGPMEAILVDAQFRISDARSVAERVAATGRRLKAIVITHAHPDHYFGIGTLLERFPGTPVYMTAGALAEFEQQVGSKIAQWSPVFGSEVPTEVPTPQLLPAGNLTVDGIAVEVLRDLQGDAATPTNSAVWIPSLRALIASDLVYEDVHVWLAESTAETRRAWRAALRRLQELGPAVVVAGHKKTADLPDAPSAVHFTVRYIAEFEAARGAAKSAEELVTAMKGKYPQAGLPIILDFAAKAAIPN